MGAQNGFSWKQVAGAAIAQPLIEAIGDSILGTRAEGPRGLTRTNVPEFASANPGIANVLTRSLQGAVSQAVVTRFTGGKFEAANIVSDAFGNLLGESFARVAQGQQETALQIGSTDVFDADDMHMGESMRQNLARSIAKAYEGAAAGRWATSGHYGNGAAEASDDNFNDGYFTNNGNELDEPFDDDDEIPTSSDILRLSASTSAANDFAREVAENDSRLNALLRDKFGPVTPQNIGGVNWAPGSRDPLLASPGAAYGLAALNGPRGAISFYDQNGVLNINVTTRAQQSDAERIVTQVVGGAVGVAGMTVDTAVDTASMLGNATLAYMNNQSNGYLGSKFDMFRSASQSTDQLVRGVGNAIASPRATMTNIFEHLAQREAEASWHDMNNNPFEAAKIRAADASGIASTLIGGAGAVRGIAGVGSTRFVNKPGWTSFSSDVRAYVRDIEAQTGRHLATQQRSMLINDLRANNYERLNSDLAATHRLEFNRVKSNLIAEWEVKTGQVWPTYTQDVVSKSGTTSRRIGQPYDAHHVIESSYGGPNQWWNIHPARFPDQHQGGIHRAGGPARKLFGNGAE